MCLRKIGERTSWYNQGLEPREYLASRSRHKAVPNSGHVNQIFSPVVPNNDGVHSVCAGKVPSDHEFLSAIQSILGPRASCGHLDLERDQQAWLVAPWCDPGARHHINWFSNTNYK